jgi:hypothetical protein
LKQHRAKQDRRPVSVKLADLRLTILPQLAGITLPFHNLEFAYVRAEAMRALISELDVHVSIKAWQSELLIECAFIGLLGYCEPADDMMKREEQSVAAMRRIYGGVLNSTMLKFLEGQLLASESTSFASFTSRSGGERGGEKCRKLHSPTQKMLMLSGYYDLMGDWDTFLSARMRAYAETGHSVTFSAESFLDDTHELLKALLPVVISMDRYWKPPYSRSILAALGRQTNMVADARRSDAALADVQARLMALMAA